MTWIDWIWVVACALWAAVGGWFLGLLLAEAASSRRGPDPRKGGDNG